MEFDSRIYNFERVFWDYELHLDVGDIFQIAEVSLARASTFPEHTQGCNEITYCVSGQATVFSNGAATTVSAGQIHFIKRGVTHRIVTTSEQNFRYICIGFTPNSSNPTVAAFEKAVGDAEYFVITDNGYAKRLSELLIRELYLFDEYSHDLIDKFISHILTAMTRIVTNTDVAPNRKSKKNSPYAIYEILRYIDREYLQIDSVENVANALSYSESYLSHLFKEKIGITLKEYISKKKIDRAMELLEQCDLTIEQISDHLKFTSARVFRRVFKQYTGYTPTQFRNK